MNVVIVESPAKAKTINKYLGKDYTVLASFGHVRDLPPKDGSVRPDEDFAMDWGVDSRSEKHIRDIVQAVKGAECIFLASDPDREGEAIAWHVLEELARRKALKGIEVKRVTFNAITKESVMDAMKNPRSIDQPLVDAYMARRALDYLVGFTLSPVLWRKLPGSRSAGRVQSVALRLICERESEIEQFHSEEYWTITAQMLSAHDKPFAARLAQLDGEKLEKFSLPNAESAENARQRVERQIFSVGQIERKQVKRHPSPPFTTSTLQQEAARKLYFSATRTMQVAQRLYEGVTVKGDTVGLITYMRTDAISIIPEAIEHARTLIHQTWGDKMLPAAARVYKTKQKNAQEAHEAIRPTDIFLHPSDVKDALEADQFKLYELIWKRTVASQMASALLDQVGVNIVSADRTVTLRASGSTIAFEGFLTLYREDVDDSSTPDAEGKGSILPPLSVDEPTPLVSVTPEQHFTQPPPRYSEASLVKKMEELGIGRPSTYASILHVLQDRNYVQLESRRFMPEDRGRIVTAFLQSFFQRYVEYNFTATLENQLDDISAGVVNWKDVLRTFWVDFNEAVSGTKNLRISEVLDTLDHDLAACLFPVSEDGADPRVCPSCTEGRLSLKLGKTGAFIGCSGYPECRYTRPLGGDGGNSLPERELGQDSETGLSITLKKGPYGWYIQLGEATDEGKKKTKPKRAGLPKDIDPQTVTLEQAVALLSLPREVGQHPETGEPIRAGIGRFGPYIVHEGKYVSLKNDSVLDIGINRAVDLLASAKERSPRIPARELGLHPEDQKPVKLLSGRYGPYVEHNKVRTNVPKGEKAEDVTLEQALGWLATKSTKTSVKKPKTTAKTKKEDSESTKKKGSERTKKKPQSSTKKTTTARTATPRKKRATSDDTP